MSANVDNELLTKWAHEVLRISHLNTLIEREITFGKLDRATDLTNRAQQCASKMLNEMFAAGASKPEGYCEPDPAQESSN